jgi:Ca-activated chloride channel family protein
MNLMDYARLSTRNGDNVMLEGVKASGDLRGVLFEMSVEQRFRNPTKKHVEVVYSFPLPWGAVLLGVDVHLGERHLSGTVVEKKQAEARYAETLSEGNAAIMLERNHDDSYSLNLGNLAAGESCVITLRYAQTLRFEQRGLRLMIPTVIAPRHGDPVRDGGLQPHQAPDYSPSADYPFDIELRLHGDLARARVASPSHPISVRTADDGMTVSLGRSGALDRDFVLVVDQLAHESAVVLARDSVDADCVVALASFCPRIPEQESAAVAVKLLVDCSGSMEGDSIDAAKSALQSIVLQLGKGDRFSLSRFGSTVEHRSRALWLTTDATRVAAQRWIGDLQADLGGTEMEAALKSTFALTSGAPSNVLMVTDGQISAIDRTIASAKASGHRVFVVGIGSSAAESHLRRLAEATGGACDFVAPGEAVEPAVLRMFARLRRLPAFDRVSVAWPGTEQPEWVTAVQPSVFNGDTVNVFALFRKAPVGEVRLLGVRPDGEKPEVIGSAAIGQVIEPAATLSKMAAHVRVAACESAQEATRLAVAYHLVTEQTNYLLVHQRAEGEQAVDMPELHKVAQMVPAGWGGAGSARYSRSVAASFPGVTSRLGIMGLAGAGIPSFLRRAAGDAPSFESLTPRALVKKLRATARAQQPASYAELSRLGLDAAVIDWLELTVAAQSGAAHTERDWVAAFVFVMSHDAMHEALTGMVVPFHPKRFIDRLDSRDGNTSPNVDRRLVEKLIESLQGLCADIWPDQVYAMSAAPA